MNYMNTLRTIKCWWLVTFQVLFSLVWFQDFIHYNIKNVQNGSEAKVRALCQRRAAETSHRPECSHENVSAWKKTAAPKVRGFQQTPMFRCFIPINRISALYNLFSIFNGITWQMIGCAGWPQRQIQLCDFSFSFYSLPAVANNLALHWRIQKSNMAGAKNASEL